MTANIPVVRTCPDGESKQKAKAFALAYLQERDTRRKVETSTYRTSTPPPQPTADCMLTCL